MPSRSACRNRFVGCQPSGPVPTHAWALAHCLSLSCWHSGWARDVGLCEPSLIPPGSMGSTTTSYGYSSIRAWQANPASGRLVFSASRRSDDSEGGHDNETLS